MNSAAALTVFENHLDELELLPGMRLAVHSRLITFGRIEGGVAAIYQALRRRLGPEATLVVPTYTLDLGADQPFDPDHTPSQKTGALAEYVRSLPQARRTVCPLHSHAVLGPDSEALLAADPKCSMGPGSLFEVMHDLGFHLLLLGCTFQEGATFVHHVEASVGVPYRRWLDLPRKLVGPNAEVGDLSCRYYGRMESEPLTTELASVEEHMRAARAMKSVPLGRRASHLMTLQALYDGVSEMLAEDRYALMCRQPQASHEP